MMIICRIVHKIINVVLHEKTVNFVTSCHAGVFNQLGGGGTIPIYRGRLRDHLGW